jgi:hypothetical protein
MIDEVKKIDVDWQPCGVRLVDDKLHLDYNLKVDVFMVKKTQIEFIQVKFVIPDTK